LLGGKFDNVYRDDTVPSQFVRLGALPQLRSESQVIELVRSLCPLTLPTKRDEHSRLIKPLCYLEERQPEGTTAEEAVRYLQGHVVWASTQSTGEETLFLVRFHTLHRTDLNIKHPTLRVYRIISNPDPFSPLGSWQYLVNGHFSDFRLIADVNKYICPDQSGNEWISGHYVDKYHGPPFMTKQGKVFPREALLSATHFSFVRESWLER
jgi:hypothetical protein